MSCGGLFLAEEGVSEFPMSCGGLFLAEEGVSEFPMSCGGLFLAEEGVSEFPVSCEGCMCCAVEALEFYQKYLCNCFDVAVILKCVQSLTKSSINRFNSTSSTTIMQSLTVVMTVYKKSVRAFTTSCSEPAKH